MSWRILMTVIGFGMVVSPELAGRVVFWPPWFRAKRSRWDTSVCARAAAEGHCPAFFLRWGN